MRLFTTLKIAAAAAWLGLAALTPAVAQDAEWAKVVEEAKKEGKVVIYNAAIGASYYLDVVKSFEQTYGIKVETLDVRASELRERVRVEQAAGRFLGDLQQHGAATSARQEAEGAFQPHGGFPNLRNLREPFKPDGARVPGFVQAYGILVNTSLVKPADEPKSWADLLDPKWKGKILSDDMRALGGGQVMFFATHDALGADFHARLAGQGLVFSRDLRNDARRVARGEYPIYIPQVFAFASDLKGLPVKVVLPLEGSPYVQVDLAMLKNAPHPNAARVFMNHFLEVQSQVAYANGWQIPVVKGAVEKANEESRQYAGAKLMGTTTPDRQEAMLELAKTFYK